MSNVKAKSNFKKAVRKAKALYKTGRYKKFSDAVKAAYKGTAIGKTSKASTRQTGSSNRSIDKKRKAKAPGKRKSASGKLYYERRKNRSDKPNTLSGAKSFISNTLKQQLSNRLLRKELATTKRDKKKWGKLASQTKKQIKQFS